MALGFFRRRQKMVIIIMVVLMVSFLVGSYGFSMLFSTDPMKQEIGSTRAGKLLRRDWYSAQADLEVLRAIGLGGNPYRYPPWPTEGAYWQLTRRNGERAGEAYMLLLAEARDAGILVSETDVDAFFAEIGCSGDAYEELMSELRSRRRWTEGFVRQVLRNWLLINKCFADSDVHCPPSETEVRLTYRDVTEQIDLRILRLKAEDYLKDVPDPNQASIDEHFNRYRTRFPGRTRKVDDMGFGYRQPGRARVRYLFVRGDVVERITEPAFDLVVDYYNRNKAEFVRKVPVGPPATAPAGAASEPASRPTRDVQMTFAEAKEQIIETLRRDAAEAKMDEVVALVENRVRRFLEGKGDPNQAFASARKGMMRGAGEPLGVVLRGVKIDAAPLDEAMARLARAARLRAICYPWGTHGRHTLLPSVKVSLQAEVITLGEALEQIGRQVKWPPEGSGKLHWAACEGFRDVLFSVRAQGEGVDFFPLSVGQTPPSTFQELSEHEVLGDAYASPAGGRKLAEIVFSAKGLSTDPREASMATVGEMGTRMYVMGEEQTGRVAWRLVEIEEEHMPRALTDRPGLRRRVVDDLRLLAAFKEAAKTAEKLKDAAEKVSLEAVAEAQKKETFTTGLFARKTFTGDFSEVPKLDLPTRELRAYVIEQAFSLAPEKVEPGAPKGPPAVLVVPIPAKAEVLVMERIGFRPVVRPEYEEFGLINVARFLTASRQRALQAIWFDLRAIQQRVGFTTQ